MKKIDIIIHGASSFLGKNFINYINYKKEILVIARISSNLNFIRDEPNIHVRRYKSSPLELNLNNLDCSKSIFYEFSWHGVYGSERNNFNQFKINVPLFVSSVEFAILIKCKHWVGIGSQAEYGNYNRQILDNDICNPQTLYGKSKFYCSKIISDLCENNNLNFSWLRLFSVYGPDDNHDWLIQYLIKKMLANEKVDTTYGDQYWDYLYIDDISEALISINPDKPIGITNLSSSIPVKIKDLIHLIKDLTNSKSVINFGAIPYRPDQVMYMCGDNNNLKNKLNWQPRISLKSGIIKTLNYIKNNNENI